MFTFLADDEGPAKREGVAKRGKSGILKPEEHFEKRRIDGVSLVSPVNNMCLSKF